MAVLTLPARGSVGRVKRRALAIVVVVLLSGCLGPAEPAPKALRQYLSALSRGDYRAAYDRTQFAGLVRSFGPAASLSYEHFSAFFTKNPLRRYVVRHVARLDRRAFETPQKPGTPFYEVDVDLTYPDGTHRETYTIEGDILGVVTVEPDRILLRSSAPLSEIVFDGVDTHVRLAEGTSNVYSLLVIQGHHEVRIGTRRFELATGPLRIVSGDAVVATSSSAPPVVDLD